MAGRFEDAAREYEKIGMKDKAEETLNKAKETPNKSLRSKKLLTNLTREDKY